MNHRPFILARPITLLALLAMPVILASCNLSRGGEADLSDSDSGSSAPRTAPGQGHVDSANAALSAGDRELALSEFTRAIAVNPNLTTAHLGVADIYREQQDYPKAESSYRRAAQIEPRNFDAQYYHGLMLHLLDRVTEAVQAYLRALAVQPNSFEANLNLSSAYYQLSENNQALVYGKRAVELDPRSGPARFTLGNINAELGRHADAVKEYQQAAELMDLTPGLLMNLAKSLGQTGRYTEMRNALLELLKKEESAGGHERLGFAAFQLGKFDEALASFNRSLTLEPDYYPALNGLGVIYLNQWITGAQSDPALKRRGIDALRRSLQIKRDQPFILDLLTKYGR
ncbi:MAG: tetratricopeptide repeat protein [Phycisphaerales bacterium]|nr:tetratricopeptide repeat protein [Phycisphaerales bacterium]